MTTNTQRVEMPGELRYESGQLSLPDPNGPHGIGWVARVNRDNDSPLGAPWERDAFAAELCRRWNAHAGLVATLRRIAACTDPQGEWLDDAELDPAGCVELARAAIAKAGGA